MIEVSVHGREEQVQASTRDNVLWIQGIDTNGNYVTVFPDHKQATQIRAAIDSWLHKNQEEE